MRKDLFPALIFASVFVLLFTCQTGTSAEDLDTLRERAEQGDADAQFGLGFMYEVGQGVPQDYARAHMWWNLAAALGHEDAMELRDLIAEAMAAGQVASAQDAARACLARYYKGC